MDELRRDNFRTKALRWLETGLKRDAQHRRDDNMGREDLSKWPGARGFVLILAMSVGAVLTSLATAAGADADTSESLAANRESKGERSLAPAGPDPTPKGPGPTRVAVDAAAKQTKAAARTRAAQATGPGTSTWLAMGDELDKAQTGPAGPASGEGKDTHGGRSLAEINNKLNNPGAGLAALNFKFIWNEYKGDLPGSSSQDSLTLEFQPVIPFKLPDGGNLILRPTIPMVWQPHFEVNKGGFGEEFGLGDSQLDIFYSRTNVKKGYMWGIGAVMQAPTHTDKAPGKDQFQLGPAGFAGLLGKWGSAGIFPQHLWNVCGSGEGYTATTFIQPWYWFNVGKGWQVGGSPEIEYDWAADDSDEAWTVPINLGVAKTIKIGKTPVKLKFEGIYYIVQPDAFGPHFGLQLTITPVVKNVFEDLF
jgi:hypothetical protein